MSFRIFERQVLEKLHTQKTFKSHGLFRTAMTFVLYAFFAVAARGQSKVNITTTLPTSIDICGKKETVSLDVRNIINGSVSGISLKLDLPSGISYVQGSLSGNGVSEKSVTNLQKPEFNLPNLSVTQSVKIEIEITSDCSLTAFLTNGGIPTISALCSYTGGSVSNKSRPITVNQPSINVKTITKQYHTGSLGDIFVREITISNGGKGGIQSFILKETVQSGLQVIGIAGGSLSKSGSVYTSTFDTSIIKKIGNKDAFFDNNESVVVRDTFKIVSCKNLATSLALSWGCDSKTCNTENYSTQVSLVNKAPNLVFTPTSSLSACFDASIPTAQELKIVNAGNDTARKTIVSINQYYAGQLSAIDTSSLTVKIGNNGSYTKANIIRSKLTSAAGVFSCLGSNPIGQIDIELPFILAGQTVYLNWDSRTCCPQSCGPSFYAHRWYYTATYLDQCQKTISKALTVGSYGYYHNLSLTSYTPTDIVDKDTLKFLYTITAANLVGNNANSLIDIYFDLPAGVKHSLQKKDFQFITHDGSVWQPTSLKMVGDSLNAQFKGVPKISLVNSDLAIKLIGDCSQSSSNSTQNYSVDINYIPNTTCKNPCVFKSGCFTGTIKVHCDNSCNSGLKFNDFKVKRISYGLPDNNNDGIADATGSLDLDKIRTERLMYGDTLLTSFKGKINRSGSITTWSRLTATTTFPYGRFLDVADATIRIYRRGKLLYSCPGIKYSNTTSGNNKTFKFDLGLTGLIASRCPIYSGFTYTTTDSVELDVKYVVATNPGNFFEEIKVTSDFYLHTVANPASYQRYQCDSFSGNFLLAGSYFTNYGRGVYSSNSCNTIRVTQNYYLSIGKCCSNYAGGNLFPSEYRSWAKPSKLIIIPPPGFDVVHTMLYDYRTSGTGSRTYQYQDTVKLTRQRGDTLEYDVSGLFEDKGGSFKLSDDGFFGVWYCTLKPNCEAKHGTSPVQYGFEFEQRGYLGNSKETYYSTVQNDQIQYDKPQIGLNVLSDFVIADADTVEWQIVIDNSSSVSNSENIWVAATSNGNSELVEIVDVSTSKKVPVINGVFQLGDLNALKSKSFIVKAVYTSCDQDSFMINVGNDCEGYPDSLSVAKCIDQQLMLSYRPKNTLLSSSIQAQDTLIDLCSEGTYEVYVKNLSNARAFDLYVDLYLQSGVQLNDTAYCFLGNSTDSFRVLNPINLGSGTYRWELSKFSNYLQKEGLAGVTSSLVNEFYLKFKTTTNCNFVSSSFFLARPGGVLKCGKPVLSSYAASKQIDIKGIVKPYYSDLQFNKKPIDICNYDGSGEMRLINLGPDTTGTNDFIHLLLPDGIYLDTTYLAGSHNIPTQKPTVERGFKYTGIWKIPSGIEIGDSVKFSYKTYVNSAELNCGSTQIIAQSVVSQPALCVKDSSYCDINVSTSNDLMLDSIKKSEYRIQVLGAESVPAGQVENVTVQFNVSNIGTQKENNIPLYVKFVADTNTNGRYDVGEPLLSVDTLYQLISTNQVVMRTRSFDALSAYVCDLVIVIDSTNCVCDQTFTKVKNVQLINAGVDIAGCSRTDLQIGTPPMKSVSYLWLTPNYIENDDSSLTNFNAINSTQDDATYPLILKTDRGSCSSVDTVIVTLYPAMFLDLADTFNICEGERLIIGEVPSGGSGFKSYQWTPTDSLQNSNGVKTWANPIQSTLYKIHITDGQGCTIEDSTFVAVRRKPIANISFRDTCVGEGYTITNASKLGDIGFDTVRYVFDFGDTIINQVPGFIPTFDSSVQVELFVLDSFGCSDADTQFISPYPLPTAGFTSVNVCQFDSIKAVNSSLVDRGTISHLWLIEDSSYTSRELSHASLSYGAIEIELNTQTDKGCVDVFKDTVEVYNKPNISLPKQSVCFGDSIILKPSIVLDPTQSIIRYDWNMDDGTTFISSNDSSYFYTQPGTFKYETIVETNNNCKDTAKSTVVINPNPVSSYSVEHPCKGDSIILNSTSSISNGSIVSNTWTIDGQQYVGGIRFAKQFLLEGLFSTSLIVQSDSGCMDTSSNAQAWVKYTEKPSLIVDGNCAESPIDFEIIITQQDSVQDFNWSFPNISRTTTGDLNALAFNAPGQYPVKITTNFSNGCSTDTNFQFTIDPKPVADFTSDLPCEDNAANFIDASTTSLGTLTDWKWSFGDGVSSIEKSPSHTFTAIGTYPISLFVTNSFNCFDSAYHDVMVERIVNPDFDITDVCVFDTTLVKQAITDIKAPITSISWKLGDGTIRTGVDSFKYAYQTSGNYDVELRFTTNAGCNYSESKQVVIHELPEAGFFMNPERADVVNSDVQFTSTASSDVVAHSYIFSNGFTTNEANFNYRFPDTATYTINQQVENQFGCKSVYSDQIIIDFVVNILIPNAFHPNDDNINNTFSPQGLGIGNYELKVYNRWGEQIFNGLNKPWTGENAIQGAYFYLITIRDFENVPHYYSGIVQLVR